MDSIQKTFVTSPIRQLLGAVGKNQGPARPDGISQGHPQTVDATPLPRNALTRSTA